MIAITGATGQLGRLVIQNLLNTVPASQIVAAVRSPEKAADLAALGVQVRQADYAQSATLDAAFQGVDKLLLISSSEVGQRAPQHAAVIAAAQKAGVKLLAYTSLLRADSSPLGLAAEHKETEAMLRASGLPHVLLRNGWYTENYTGSVPAALQYGAVMGSAKDGRIASAARADYAAAAAAVLTKEGQAGQVYELAGDTAYTLAELAAEIAKQSGKPVVYNDLPQAAYAAALVQVGLPEGFAALLADSDVGASKGALFDDSHQLSQLIGRPTTPLAEVVKTALAG
ncbi:MAG: SDR family oxidoreductase [Hydrogenophaga sp.]|jgi:NAD(P)H dehydrogenase (quinone)|uniref:SDR family oxidoreductase n=1 Tax=Hydrogenophaga sp. TaxID=1904254 RepID=UPI002718E0A9|nr:SDR family oxidoreductase [Hydrogenophaga sp.]MDO9481641.1 SDR family oxidoreductase [Hydrogenophaga sp.]MDP3805266.1 SDR family oxidoreductase [Hydrogenophaga sp.]